MNPWEIESWIIGIIFGLFAVFTVAMPTQLFLAATGRVRDVPDTPDDFVPAVRLVAFTDSHNRNDNVAKAIDTADFRIPGGKLESGRTYTLRVRAVSAYLKRSAPLKLTFTAQ